MMSLSTFRSAERADRTYFEATAAPLPPFPCLAESRRCDVCIVGAGFLGLSAALHLAGRGFHVVVLESRRVGAGASGRNSGFVLPGYAVEVDALLDRMGPQRGARLWRLSVDAVALVRSLAAQHGIDCDLKPGALTAAATPADAAVLARQATAMRRLGYAEVELLGARDVRSIVDGPNYHGGLLDRGAAHLHPLDFARGLARAARAAGAEIVEDSAVLRLERGDAPAAVTAAGRIEARHLVVAANATVGSLAPDLARRIVPIVAHLGVTAPLGRDVATGLIRRDVAVYDTQPALDYYRRTPDHRLIFGSAVRFLPPPPGRAADWLARNIARVFPQVGAPRIEFAWEGWIDLTRNRLPDIGRRGGLWYAQGFNGHGVALAALTGRIIADAIAGTTADFDLLQAIPFRAWPGGPRLARAALPFVRAARQLGHALGRGPAS